MATMNLRFAFEKETKGAVRFQEVGEDGKPAFARALVRCTSEVGACRWQDTSDADRYHHDLTNRFQSRTRYMYSNERCARTCKRFTCDVNEVEQLPFVRNIWRLVEADYKDKTRPAWPPTETPIWVDFRWRPRCAQSGDRKQDK